MDGKTVVVTTKHRGVFAGTVKGEASRDEITLTDARNIIHWSADTGGFGGLAVDGPGDGSRLGSIMPEIRLFDITGIVQTSEGAHQRLQEWPVWRG